MECVKAKETVSLSAIDDPVVEVDAAVDSAILIDPL
jgi:hypothetical protein